MSKKENKSKKKKRNVIVYRTKEQRQEEIKNILKQLNDFELGIKYEPIKNLYKKFKEYIGEGNRIKINIPFPEINRRIKGLLAISVREEVWLRLEREKF